MEGEGGEKDEEKDAKKRRLSAMMKIIEKIETEYKMAAPRNGRFNK